MKANKVNKKARQSEEDKKLSLTIDLLNNSYHYHKRVLYEEENGYANYDDNRLTYSRRSVSRIEKTLLMLPEREKLIIEAEVINSKKGTKWYREFFSTPSYYRNRKTAYKMFIDMINR